MAGPVSSRTSGWKLHDWLFALFFVVLIVSLLGAAVHAVAPNSGVGIALHNAGHAVGNVLLIIASFLNLVAGWFNSL